MKTIGGLMLLKKIVKVEIYINYPRIIHDTKTIIF
jgi:hypothetical protein